MSQDRFEVSTRPQNHAVAWRKARLLMAGCTVLLVHLTTSRATAQEGAAAAKPSACIETDCAAGTVQTAPVAKGSRVTVPDARSAFDSAGDIPFAISVEGETVVKSNEPQPGIGPKESNARTHSAVQAGSDRATPKQGLNAVDIQVKFDGLDARPVLNVSTSPVRTAYRTGEPIRFLATSNYPAFIQRSEIRVFEDDEQLTDKPVAVIAIPVNGEAGWTMPATENDDQRFKYVLRVYDADNRYDETLPRPLRRMDRDLPREEENAVAPGMTEDNTGSRDIPVRGGAVTVYGRNVPEGYRVQALDDTIPVDRERSFVMQRILPPGDHDVDVTVVGAKGSALDFRRQINIPNNDWFYVALADLTIGKNSGSNHIETVRPGEYDDIYTKGRLAFYVKGKIKGKYLLTASADTGEDSLDHMFRGLDAKDPRQLLRRLDPNDYYPIYGDDSTAIDDAPTKGKFYVRLERGDSQVLWGSYKAIIQGTEFMRSDRALYGASSAYRSEKTTPFGERNTEVTIYAAQPDTLPQRDEFLGTGGSAYFMRRQDITIGSETVTVEVRDSTTGQIIERRTLRYGEDYSFDYLQGMLILKRPLSSSTGTTGPVREGALGGNKVYLVSQYEYTPIAGDLDGYAYGGRAQQWLDDKVRVGVTGMNENTGLANQKAYGADIKVRHSDTTFIEGEISRSDGPGFGTSRSTDGGLTLSDVQTTGTRGRLATAWRTRAQLDLEDISKSGIKGTLGGYFQEKDAGFSTLSEQVAADQRIWGLSADIDIKKDLSLDLTYDDFKEGEATDDFYDQAVGGRSKRKGAAAISKQLNEYWKASFGVTYLELSNPLATASNKSGYDGSRLDAGARLEYAPDADHTYYGFGQGTLSRSGDIERGDRLGVGAEYQITEKIGLSGEVSYGATGLGALAAVTYEPTAEDSYYLGYRLDPDRAFDLDRSYDLDGTDYGAIVIGARRKLDDYWSTYAENNYDLFGRRNSLAQTYGVVYTPDAKWTVDGGLEIGTVEDDTIDPSTNLERSDFDRKAISLSVGYKDEDRIAARIRGETRFEDSDDDTRDLNTYLFATGFSWKTNDNWRLLVNIDSVLSDSNGDGSFRDGDYVEASLGYAYRPITNDRLNALFKYTWLYDLPGEDQVSAVTGDEYGPAQRSNILSADFTYDLVPWLSVGAKYGFRYGEVRERLQDDLDAFSDWQTSSAHLGIVRTDFHIVKKWDALLEGRVMYMAEADTTDLGVLTAVYRHVGDNFKVGVGYNFGNFSDDLRDLTLNDRGVFFNLVGKY